MANAYYRYKPAYINPFPMPSDDSILSIERQLEELVDKVTEVKSEGKIEKMHFF